MEIEHNGSPRGQAATGPIDAVETEALHLAVRIRQMAAGNQALRVANQTLSDTNEGLRRDIAEARADTAAAHAETIEAQADAADIITHNDELQAETGAARADTADVIAHNDELQATVDEMGTRNDELQAMVDEVERDNTALRAHRLEVQELADVLQAERSQLAVILASFEDAVLEVDQEGAIVRANTAYVQLFGAEGVALYDAQGHILAPDQTPRARAARGETFSLSFSLATGSARAGRQDTRRWFEATGQPLQEDGTTRGIVVIRDVTLSDRYRRLQDQFLMLAGHELRTPLTSIQGYLDMVAPLLGAEGNERARLYAMRALHQTRRLVALVRDLTDAARLQSGRLALAYGPLDLVAMVEQVVEIAQELPPRHTLHLDIGAVPVWVSGDAGRLEQVLFNLLTNARTYAPSDTPIDVRLRRVGAEVVLEVQDYGRGIAAEHLPHLFGRFFQVERADRPAQGGLGLGLYLCRELISAHGGRIAVGSTVGEGTTFSVWLPVLDDARDVPAPSLPAGDA